MQRRAYLTAALVLTLIAALWTLRMSQRPSGAVQPEAADVGTALPQQDAGAKPVESPAAPQRDEVTASGSTLEGEMLAVRVLASGTFDPVAGVEVLYWPALDPAQEDGEELVRRLLRSNESRTLLSSAGRTTSDADGRAQLPDAVHGVLVLARAEGRFGLAQFLRGESPPLEVLLQRDFPLEARVLDELGAALEGVDVELRVGDDPRTAVHQRERSSADGLVRFEHAGFAIATWGAGSELGSLAVAEPTEPPAELEFALAEPPRAPVELVVPRGGECEVRIVGRDGQPASGHFDVILGYLPGEDVELEELDPSWASGARRSDVEGPSVLFRHVQLGRELLATVLRDGAGPAHRAIGSGPAGVGARAVIEVRLGERCTLIEGRALAESGEPRAGALLELRLGGEDTLPGMALASAVRTSGEGRFEFEVETARWIELGDVPLQLVELDSEGGEVAEAAVRVTATPDTLRVDLGNVRLQSRALYASGRVVTSELEPVCGAWVMGALLHEEPGVPAESALELLPHVRARTDALGRFELRVPRGLAELQLLAGKGELRSPPLRATMGVQDLQIVLQPRAEIAGRLVVDPTISMSRVLVVATRKDLSSDGEGILRVRPEPDGRFVLRGVRPGEHSVTVHAVDGYAELARVEGVFALAGERTLDARLDPLDLRAGHRTVSIALRDESGAPFAGEVSVVVRTVGSEGERALFAPVLQGVASVLVGEKPPLVTVLAPGHLAQVLGPIDGDRVVTLLRAPQLRFLLAEGVESPPLPFRLAVELRPTSSAARDVVRHLPKPEFGGNRIARCDAVLTGKLQVALHLVRRTEDSWNEVEIPLDPTLVIDVRERGEQAFEVRCTPEALDSALRALGGR